jgi:hypothetical protein
LAAKRRLETQELPNLNIHQAIISLPSFSLRMIPKKVITQPEVYCWSMVVTFQQLQTRFSLITNERHRFCSIQNYLDTKENQLNAQRPRDRALRLKSPLCSRHCAGDIEAMACGEAFL